MKNCTHSARVRDAKIAVTSSRSSRVPSEAQCESSGSSPRSIIATTTEIYDYLRLLFAHVGQPHEDFADRVGHKQAEAEVDEAVVHVAVGAEPLLQREAERDLGIGVVRPDEMQAHG